MDWNKIADQLNNRVPGLMDASGRYAVLVPLVERDGEVYVLYEVRAATMRRQPGEVCFPGGHIEGDESPENCAVRETWEELGIPAEKQLEKFRDNRANSGLKTPAERRANVLGVYRAVAPEKLRGKRVLLLDDIVTTGATASECARVLMTAGAEEVYFAALAAAGKPSNK